MQSPPLQNCLLTGLCALPQTSPVSFYFLFLQTPPYFPQRWSQINVCRETSTWGHQDVKEVGFPCVEMIGSAPCGSSTPKQTCWLHPHKQAKSQKRVVSKRLNVESYSELYLHCRLIFLTLCSSSVSIVLFSACILLPTIQDSWECFAIIFIRVDRWHLHSFGGWSMDTL